jgi:ComF family protein
VPLHRERERQRGFNQSADLAARLARETGAPVSPALRRLRNTPAQAGLTAMERRVNLQGAFALDERWRRRVAQRHVALVDDVYTTGSTAAACAAVLRAAGARRVDFWAVARA